jgi:tetratricopeptide (TPR) repeat protein
MRASPLVMQAGEPSPKERVAFLDRCLQVSAQSEEAWLEFARLAKAGDLNDLKATAATRLTTLTKTFAKHPDFIARLSDDLLTPETSVLARIKHYERVIALYEKAGRPDLACNARLKVAHHYEDQKRYKEAAQSLTQAVRKFPAEGRYIPGLLKAYETVCASYPQGVKPLANLYLELGPTLVLHYRGDRNPFLDKVLAQATSFFEEHNLTLQGNKFTTLIMQAKARAGAMKK